MILGERLRLRAVEKEDIDRFVVWLNDPEIRKGIDIFIAEKQYWNQGYGSEAVRMLLKHGFDTLNLNRIFLRVFEDNPRAIRAYEKVGFVHEGRLRKAKYRDGQYLDILLMSVLREEWKNSR